jgi:hypothetical protein
LYVLLSLLQQGTERFGHISQAHLVGLGKALAISLQLLALEAQIGFEGGARALGCFDSRTEVVGRPPRKAICEARTRA